jgi:integrase
MTPSRWTRSPRGGCCSPERGARRAGSRGFVEHELVTPTVRDRSWFDRALERAERPRMTIHGLRHTAAPLAVVSGAGAGVKAHQTVLGHASAARTPDVYADCGQNLDQ